jgi:hypothetical protein
MDSDFTNVIHIWACIMNVNVVTNGLRVIDMVYCGNVPVNEDR